ncbi:uncharacterized protein BDV14DRAFT_195376 [Aspergillus stella-maris]|uniref:uncharacterized protein n=1 Tax=Aspergillus stella-maris TaxID=1810926 RepID=UPI003CCD3E61
MAPLVLTTFAVGGLGGGTWFCFYDITIGCAAAELLLCAAAFWDMTAAPAGAVHYLPADESESGEKPNGNRHSGLSKLLLKGSSARITWTGSVFLFLYVGIELGLAGWTVTYMSNVKEAGAVASGLVLARSIAGENSAGVYIILEAILAIIIHVVPNSHVAAVATAMQGFFLGLLFPDMLVATARLVSEETYMGAIGVVAGFSSSGSTLLPFLIGVVAETRGVRYVGHLSSAVEYFVVVEDGVTPINLRLSKLNILQDDWRPVSPSLQMNCK